MTLEKAVLNIEKKDFRPGLSKGGLMFETTFDYERFRVTPGQIHKDRELDYS
ncbi:hypothetical protein Egran_04054, partial [Elaphomyces granulatus]